MYRLLRIIVLFMLLATAAGCATNQQFAGNRFTLPETVKADEGIVLVKLIGVQPLSAFNAKWRTLRLENKDGVSFEVQDTAPGAASYSLFLGTLPAGRYRITQLESFGRGPGLLLAAMTSDFKDVLSQFGTVTIKPGAVTNLGTVVFGIPEEGKGTTLKTAVLADEAGLASALSDVDNAAKPRLAKRERLSWDQAPDANAGSAALAIIRGHSSNLSPIQKTRGGQLIVGGALGLIHQRDPNGKWESKSVGAFDTLTYVRELDDGRIFAGTDSGRYHLWSPKQGSWQRYDLPERDSMVIDLEPVGKAGYVIQVGHLGGANPFTALTKKSFILKPVLEEAGNQKELLSLDGMSALGRPPTFFDGEDFLVWFNHPGISRQADFYRINPQTLTRRMEQVDYWVKDVYRLPDGTLVLDRMNGMSLYVSFSGDNGRTWRHGDVAGPHTARFIDASRGYGISNVSTGWSSVQVVLNKTENGGKSWTPVGTPTEASGWMRILPLGQKQLALFTGLKILSTQDEGKTWQTEWPAE